jgi:hypothetical protein
VVTLNHKVHLGTYESLVVYAPVTYNPFVYGQVHGNSVFYKTNPKPGHRYRQIAVHELEKFLVVIGHGDVVQTAERFVANCDTAEITTFPDLETAIRDASEQAAQSEKDGWIPYHG